MNVINISSFLFYFFILFCFFFFSLIHSKLVYKFFSGQFPNFSTTSQQSGLLSIREKAYEFHIQNRALFSILKVFFFLNNYKIYSPITSTNISWFSSKSHWGHLIIIFNSLFLFFFQHFRNVVFSSSFLFIFFVHFHLAIVVILRVFVKKKEKKKRNRKNTEIYTTL